uniref:Uncharacterized protein n=1 Tax=viral metagenome TaxID=1070528 RepID=A0A6M3K423_9ZZZZ
MKKYIVGEDLKQGSECVILDNVVHKVESAIKPRRELPKKIMNLQHDEVINKINEILDYMKD